MNSKTATLIGLLAILLWSLIVALIKEVSTQFGAVGGAALIYTLASIFLLLSVGWTPLKSFPKTYLIWGALSIVVYLVLMCRNNSAIRIGGGVRNWTPVW